MPSEAPRTAPPAATALAAAAVIGMIILGFALTFGGDTTPTRRTTRPAAAPTHLGAPTAPPTSTTTTSTGAPLRPSIVRLSAAGGQPDSALPPGWLRCRNDVVGYSIGVPGDWFALGEPIEPSDRCRAFDPEPILVWGTDVIPETVQIFTEVGEYDALVRAVTTGDTAPTEFRTTNVGGNRAVFYTRRAGTGPNPTRVEACYAIDRAGRAFEVCTVDRPTVDGKASVLSFDQRRALLDQLVATLRLS